MLFLFYHYDTFILSICIAGRSVIYSITGMSPASYCHTLAIDGELPQVRHSVTKPHLRPCAVASRSFRALC